MNEYTDEERFAAIDHASTLIGAEESLKRVKFSLEGWSWSIEAEWVNGEFVVRSEYAIPINPPLM